MAETERIYNIPLRVEWLKVPRYRRAKKAVRAVKEFLVKNMKTEEVRLGRYLNLRLWERGIKNPPHHIKVRVSKDDKGIATAELFDAPADKKATVDDKVKKAGKKEEAKAEEKKIEVKTPATEEKSAAEKPKKAASKPKAEKPKAEKRTETQ